MNASQFPGQTLAPIPGISGGEDQFSNIQKINQLLFNIVAAGGFGPSGITQLTGDGTAGPGSGSQALTVTKSNGVPFGSGAFATAIAPGGADQSIQINSGGTAFGGLTGMTATAGALTGISFTGITQCTTFKAAGGAGVLLFDTADATYGLKMNSNFSGALGATALTMSDAAGNVLLQLANSIVAVPAGANLRLGAAATTGLVAGTLAATTNASIVITDSGGQAYRIPCII